VLKLPLPEADRLAKLIPVTPGMDLKKAYKDVKELNDAFTKGEPVVRKTLEFASVLEGSARHTGTHACGVIIGKDDLREYIPLSTAKDTDMPVTQYEGKYVEYVGMLKMDFLGLKTLSIIKDALRNIKTSRDIDLRIEDVPLDDAETFEMFQRGDTIGIFQFESDGMRGHLKNLKPTNIEDLIAMNALYRPGPMEFIPTYINRKHGREKVEYPHPLLEQILTPTYGIMVYQEQIMQAAQVMGGFSLGKADNLRRAMGKKKMDVMEKEKTIFVAGAAAKGVSEDKASKVFAVMQEFANYGFNRSHSAAYSILAYQTAYLKAHFPAEFMASVLTHNLSDLKKITFFIDESKHLGIDVLPPDINESGLKFGVNKMGGIRFGLAAVKGVGEAAVEAIMEERAANGPFSGIFDFMTRVNLRSVNKKSMESLAMAGVFDCFTGLHRAMFFYREPNEEVNFLEKLIRHAGNVQNRQRSTQVDLFGSAGMIEQADPALPQCPVWTKLEQLKYEKEVTGFYVSGHPLDDFKIEIDYFCNVGIEALREDISRFRGRDLHFAGMVSSVNHRIAKNGNPFGSFVIEDYSDSLTLTLFSEDYLRFKHFLVDGAFLMIRARVESRYNTPNNFEIKVVNINLLSETLDRMVKEMSVCLHLQDITEERITLLKDSLLTVKGKCKLNFQILQTEEQISLKLRSRQYSVNCSESIMKIKNFDWLSFKFNQ